jgi:hypothetical protein
MLLVCQNVCFVGSYAAPAPCVMVYMQHSVYVCMQPSWQCLWLPG